MECEPSRMMTFSCTQIEVNNEVHMFVVKDQGHPQNIEFMQISEVVRAHARCGVCALYKKISACCGRRRIGVSVVSP
jgi:hypothetical protein